MMTASAQSRKAPRPLGSLDYSLDQTRLAGQARTPRALPAHCQERPIRPTKGRLNSAARQVAPNRGRPIVAAGASSAIRASVARPVLSNALGPSMTGTIIANTEQDAAAIERGHKGEIEMSHRNRLMVLLAAAGMLVSTAALAQDYPTKPITLIVPWPAGGSTDISMRAIAESASKVLGQPIAVDNKAGGGAAPWAPPRWPPAPSPTATPSPRSRSPCSACP
ncbi:hypothetical protein ACVIHI_007708 [Bradyrhizobium sp. USDA 4524]